MVDIKRFNNTKSLNVHIHKWFMVQRGSDFQQINPGNNTLFEKVEYAVLICTVDNSHPEVLKVPVNQSQYEDLLEHNK